jgi:RND family efflux transporter MFP subunit
MELRLLEKRSLTTRRPRSLAGHRTAIAVGAALLTAVAACHPEEPKPAGFGPMPVRVATMTPVTVADQDEYLASLTSRHSVTLYAQVSGVVQTLGAKPGATVKAGTLLVQIDPAQQASTLRSLQASLETKKANLAYAIQNDESSKGLQKSGLLSELDYDQRHSQRVSAEADAKTTQAQIDAQSALLRYYRITAPTDGVVGDVPVKVGDYVTPQTRLTSVVQDRLIEAYVYVPVGKVASITPETTIDLLDNEGKVVCEEKPTFVSPDVNVDTQSVLVKTVCPNDGVLRAAQVLKARLVWAKHQSLTVPTSAATRQAGQFFVYVVGAAGAGQTGEVAHQVPIKVGAIQENAYVVTSGLSAGDAVIVSGIQKLHDGAPVSRLPDAPPPVGSSAASGPANAK